MHALLEALTSERPRYRPDAYVFAQEAFLRLGPKLYGDILDNLDFTGDPSETAKRILEQLHADEVRPHLTPEETARRLLEELERLAREKFGDRARPVLHSWGIRCGQDFGEVCAFLLGRELSSTEESARVFREFDFEAAFPFDPKTNLCDRCHQQEATIHLSQVLGGRLQGIHLCEQCARDLPGIAPCSSLLPLSAEDQIQRTISGIVAGDPRYRSEAYCFVGEAIRFACSGGNFGVDCGWTSQPPHVSVTEALDALRKLALQRFGNRAKSVLADWGIHRCEDVGEIVFHLVDAGLLAKRPEDRKEDFQGGYDFNSAFPET